MKNSEQISFSTPYGNPKDLAEHPAEGNRYINYLSVSEAFKRDGWKCCHKFQVGNYWQKGDDEATCFYGKYKLNGKEVDLGDICKMLSVDSRFLQMCKAMGPHSPHSKYGATFFAGVQWADTNPPANEGNTNAIDQRAAQVAAHIAPYPINGKYGQLFLDGVRWADAHPIDKNMNQ